MAKTLVSHERTQTRGEEIANSVSHGVGFLAAVAASPVLIFSAVQHGSSAGIVGASVFAFTMLLLYITSTLYHTLASNKAKRIRYAHFIWHLFVIAGTACHFIAVLRYAV